MRVDFYLLSRDPVEAALPRIARKSVKGAGERLLVGLGDDAQLAALDKALWEQFPEELPRPRPGRRARTPRASRCCSAADLRRRERRALRRPRRRRVARRGGSAFERAFLFFDDRTLARRARHLAHARRARGRRAALLEAGRRALGRRALSGCDSVRPRLGRARKSPTSSEGTLQWRPPAPFRSSSPTPPAAT